MVSGKQLIEVHIWMCYCYALIYVWYATSATNNALQLIYSILLCTSLATYIMQYKYTYDTPKAGKHSIIVTIIYIYQLAQKAQPVGGDVFTCSQENLGKSKGA